MRFATGKFFWPTIGVGLLFMIVSVPTWAGSQTSSLTVTNLASSDIVNTSVSGIDNFDWADSNRPDHNFQGKTISVGTSFTAQENMNSSARSSWFNLQMTFRNGDTLTFRNDQKDSLTGARNALYRIYTPQSGATNKYTLVQYAGGGKNYFAVLPNVPTASWMSLLPDSTSIASLTIPGTHDSSTWNTTLRQARTQNRNFGQQLGDGIRFWDIRVRRVKDTSGNPAWAIHHGSIYLNMNFNDVLNAAKAFLAVNTRETLIMSIKEDSDPMPGATASMSQTFWQYVRTVPAVSWYTGTAYPTLGQTRGKVILLRRYQADPGEQVYGLNATNWPDNAAFTISNPPQSIGVQDVYKAGGSDKSNAVAREMQLARSNTSPDWTFINFTSSSTGSCVWTPDECARGIMPAVRPIPIVQPSKTRLGIVPMDYYEIYAPFLTVLLGANMFP